MPVEDSWLRGVALVSDRRFDELVRRHAGAVAAYARAIAPDPWTAEDAFQETFLRAWKYLDSYRASGSFEGWLIRICRNCVVDVVRQRTQEPSANLPDPTIGFDTSHEIYDLLGQLPLAQREVIALCGLLGYDYESAAELLEIPIGTVRSRLHRARATIADLLYSDGTEVSA